MDPSELLLESHHCPCVITFRAKLTAAKNSEGQPNWSDNYLTLLLLTRNFLAKNIPSSNPCVFVCDWHSACSRFLLEWICSTIFLAEIRIWSFQSFLPRPIRKKTNKHIRKPLKKSSKRSCSWEAVAPQLPSQYEISIPVVPNRSSCLLLDRKNHPRVIQYWL